MTVVLDSNVAVALALDTERAPAIEERLRAWEEAGESLHALSLFRFEVASALTRNIAAGKTDSADAKVAWQRIVAIEISLHGLTDGRLSLPSPASSSAKAPTMRHMWLWLKS